jgi:carboxymethylenebutenolidase
VCHDHDSRPPAPPRTGDVAERGVLTLTGADGTAFAAAYAAPAEPAGAGVVLLPDVRGLHPFYVALAEQFAQAGLPTVAIDWFGRTAGVPEGGVREADFAWRPHVEAATAEEMDADIAAALAYLRERAGARLPVVTVGFCLGGSISWRQSGGELDLAGCVGFYGKPSVVGDAADRARLPTVMLVAGSDAATPVADQLALAERMRAAGADVDAVVYDGAPHSFFDRAYADWADACRDAWAHVLALTDRVARR